MRIEHVGWALLLVAGLGCATGRGRGADGRDTTTVELTVHNLDDDMQRELEGELKKLPGQKSVTLKHHDAGTATWIIESTEDPATLELAVADIQRPALKDAVVIHTLEFTAQDLAAPTITWIHPADGQVLSRTEQNVLLEVPDKDVKELLVNAHVATRFKGHNVYKAQVTLPGGEQDILVVVTDRRGNKTTRKVHVTVDDRPRTMKDMQPVHLEGKVAPGTTVILEGEEVPVDILGAYRTDVRVRPGQTQVQVLTLDADGKRSISTQDVPKTP